MKRRQALSLGAMPLLPAAGALAAATDSTASGEKVLRYAFRVAETGFDPAQVNDIYSRTVTPHIFEALYQYDPLARPVVVRPLTAAGMPEHSDDYTTWTVKIRPGIFFADDPAFKGQRRELVADDYVFTYKRFADPAVKSPAFSWMLDFELVGLKELRQQAIDQKRPFDYDRPIDGLQALDRYTVRFRCAKPQPRFLTSALTGSDLVGAVAREVVQTYGDKIPAHPVGTGPFRLKSWRRSSQIVLEKSPFYREVRYDAAPAPDDLEGQAILKRFKGRRLPMIDRVEISIVEEEQPRWLTFLQNKADLMHDMQPEFINQAMPAGKVAPNLARRGINGHRLLRSDSVMTLFNMEDPVVGGYSADKVALRRAISLGLDVPAEINLVRRSQGIPAQSPSVPNTWSYEPRFKSEMGDYNPSRAKALLDLYGYVDRDGDGWRERPDGQPLVLRMNTQPDSQARALDDLWRRDMKVLGVRIEFNTAKWPENLKTARAGKFQMWRVGGVAADPDGQTAYARYHSKQIGGQNMARFRNAEFDALFDRMSVLPNNDERRALFDRARRIAATYMPYKIQLHRYVTDMTQPWLVGYRRPLFWQEFWQYVDIDGRELASA